MNTIITSPQASIPATTRLPTDLNERVEKLVKEQGRSKSDFLKEAARFYAEFCETVNLDEMRQQEAARFYTLKKPDPTKLPVEAPLVQS